MTNVTVFVQIQGQNALQEAALGLPIDGRALRAALTKAGIPVGDESLIFVDEDDEPAESGVRIQELKAGTRLHVSPCRRVKTTVNYLDKTISRQFPPGTRVKRVKEWVAREFDVKPTDAGEHVLQICQSDVRPAADVPLIELVEGCGCGVCFEFVPDKRVEG